MNEVSAVLTMLQTVSLHQEFLPTPYSVGLAQARSIQVQYNYMRLLARWESWLNFVTHTGRTIFFHD